MKNLESKYLYSKQIAQSTKTIKSMLDKALLISQLPVADEQTKDPCDKNKDKLSVRVYGHKLFTVPRFIVQIWTKPDLMGG